MTWVQPHPDTKDPGLFSEECWYSEKSQMSVSIAGAPGGGHYLWCSLEANQGAMWIGVWLLSFQQGTMPTSM